MDSESKDYVRTLLLDMLRDGVEDPVCGICSNVHWSTPSYELAKEVLTLMGGWPSYSGTGEFHVPSSAQGINSCNYYLHYARKDGLWTGNQLMYRRSLLRYMIRRLDEGWL